MIKLIGLDLDGTLLTDDKQFPPGFWEVASGLIRKGVAIVIASGRPFHNVADVFKRMKDDLYFACDNGTYVVHRDEELLVNPMTRDSVNRFIEVSRPIEHVYPVMCGKNIAFVESNDPGFMSQALKYYQEYRVVSDLTKVDELTLKLSLCDLIDAEMNSYPHFRKFESDYSIAVSGKMWLDITNLDGNKGTAIQKIQKHLGITPGETLAFGDFLNDVDMLKSATHSYAMKNAHPKVKEAANHVTRLDNNHFGVMEVIKELTGVS